MQYFLGILLVAALLYFVARWFVNQPPSRIIGVLSNASKYALIGLGLLLVIRGQFYIGVPMIAAGLLPLLGIGGRGGWMGQGRSPRSSGKTSQVRSLMLEMELDHDSGEVDGVVLNGRFEGSRLSDLSLPDLMDLYAECAAQGDQSAALLQAFLDRMHPDWHEHASAAGKGTDGASAASGGRLSREQAYEVLGLPVGAADADVKQAHKTLMKRFHPDRGGSDYIAAMINQAKDVLLEG